MLLQVVLEVTGLKTTMRKLGDHTEETGSPEQSPNMQRVRELFKNSARIFSAYPKPVHKVLQAPKTTLAGSRLSDQDFSGSSELLAWLLPIVSQGQAQSGFLLDCSHISASTCRLARP